MEFFAQVRKDNIRHQWQQEKYPPQLRHEPWLARGDTRLPPNERGRIFDTKTGQGREIGNKTQRPDVVCRSAFATKRAPGRLAASSEPLSRQLDIPRHAWLKNPASQLHNYHLPPQDQQVGNSSGAHTKRRSLLEIPSRPLECVASYLSLSSFGHVEVTSKGWHPVLKSAATTGLIAQFPKRITSTIEVRSRGKFHPHGNVKLAPVERYESVTRAYRFALLCERRMDQPHVGHSCLSQGPSAKHSLVVTSTKLDSSAHPGSRILQSFG
jgi:hypothetical protein